MTIYYATLLAIFNQIGYGASRVVVALYALHLGANALTVGLIAASYSMGPTLLSIAIGRFASRRAPRPIMIVGTASTVICLLLPPIFQSVWVLFVAAFFLGLTHQVFSIPLETVVGAISDARTRTRNYSIISMGWSIANFIGPIVAGLTIDRFGILYGFWVLAAFAAVPVVLLGTRKVVVPAHAVHAAKDSHSGSVLDLWRMPTLRNIIIAAGLVGSARDLFQFYMPIYGHAIGLSASAIGTVIGALSLASFVIRAVMPWVIKRYTEAQVLTCAVFLAAGALALIPLSTSPYLISLAAFALGLGVGSAEPITLSLFYTFSPRGRMPEALGLFKALRNGTQILVPVVFGSLGAALGYAAVYWSQAGLLTCSGWLCRGLKIPSTRVRGN